FHRTWTRPRTWLKAWSSAHGGATASVRGRGPRCGGVTWEIPRLRPHRRRWRRTVAQCARRPHSTREPREPFMTVHHPAWVAHRAVAAALTVLLHVLILAALLHVTTRALPPPPPAQWFQARPQRPPHPADPVVSLDLAPHL